MEDQDVDQAYRAYFRVIFAKCTRMTRDRELARDLAQETFTRLWRHRRSIRDSEAALAWIYRTATRLAIDRLRARTEIPDPLEASWNGEGTLESRSSLARLFSRLSTREREALILTRVDGMTQGEAAAAMNISERTLRRVLTRADEKIARHRRGSA